MEACTAVCGGLAAAGVIFFIVIVSPAGGFGVGSYKALIIYCMIFHKAGFHWALGLLTLVPIAGHSYAVYSGILRLANPEGAAPVEAEKLIRGTSAASRNNTYGLRLCCRGGVCARW